MENEKLSLFKCFTLFFALSLFFSCSKDETPENNANYKLLGITSVKINNSQIPLKSDGVLLDLADYKDIVATGLLNEPNKKGVEVDYAILTTNLEDSSVQIQSKYSDVSIVVDKI
ncbi:MAG: hypothetical protein PHX50_14310, partial [Massilibacteroides sp.]|nr:hypothetical protein [Massilibacteroides sp.]MDD3063972.1 hypothetical protein [Massilibacteroides sp.]MDD4661474.1 hypothetical protein [Massilibacteroides sp.]